MIQEKVGDLPKALVPPQREGKSLTERGGGRRDFEDGDGRGGGKKRFFLKKKGASEVS